MTRTINRKYSVIYQAHNNVNRARYTRQITSRTRFPDIIHVACCCRWELTRAAAIKSVMRERVPRMVPSGHLISHSSYIFFFLQYNRKRISRVRDQAKDFDFFFSLCQLQLRDPWNKKEENLQQLRPSAANSRAASGKKKYNLAPAASLG